MPGTPDPVLGSDAVTLAVAAAAAVPVGLLPLLVRRRLTTGRRTTALLGGAAYGGLCSLLWVLVRLVAAPRLLPDSPLETLWLAVISAAVVGLQAVVAGYLHDRFRLRLPLAGLYGLTMLVLFTCLRVGGESPGYLLYLFAVPFAVIGLSLLGALELGGRRLKNDGGDGPERGRIGERSD